MTTKPRKPSEGARKIATDHMFDLTHGERLRRNLAVDIDRLCARVRREAEVEGVWTAGSGAETTDWATAYRWVQCEYPVTYSLRPKRRKGRAT